uniref:Uncharacterized protein n=1 Tax=Anguilla anguilla TaxID=7936 RepID=A0A0E9XB14_ANGAN
MHPSSFEMDSIHPSSSGNFPFVTKSQQMQLYNSLNKSGTEFISVLFRRRV